MVTSWQWYLRHACLSVLRTYMYRIHPLLVLSLACFSQKLSPSSPLSQSWGIIQISFSLGGRGQWRRAIVHHILLVRKFWGVSFDQADDPTPHILAPLHFSLLTRLQLAKSVQASVLLLWHVDWLFAGLKFVEPLLLSICAGRGIIGPTHRDWVPLIFYSVVYFRMRVKKLPMILALHLKRFKYMEQLHRYTKLSYRVVFPLELRLFNTSSDAVNLDRMYDLVAVVVHCGRWGRARSALRGGCPWATWTLPHLSGAGPGISDSVVMALRGISSKLQFITSKWISKLRYIK